MAQLSFLDDVQKAERPWKRQRNTARAVVRRKRDHDKAEKAAGRETRQAQVLRCLSAYWNRTQTSPTALELLDDMRGRGEKVFDANSVRPRIRELFEAGLVEPAGKRRCRMSGETVHTWRVREMGGQEPR